ncbi:MAG: polysaccharide deacetylase family protein [Bacillaceae bacterium]
MDEELTKKADKTYVDEKFAKFKESNTMIKKGYIVLQIDDGNIEFLTRQKPVFDAKSIKCDLAVNPGVIGKMEGKLSWSQLLQLKQEGYGLYNHGYLHKDPNTITEVELESNYEKEKVEFIANGLDTYDYYIYPGVQPKGNAELKNKLKKFYKCSFANADAFSGNPIPFDNYEIKREAIYGDYTTVINYMDRMIQNKGIAVLFGHAQDAGFTPESLTRILDYIIAKGYEVISTKKLIDKFQNVIELGHPNGENFYVSQTGHTSFDNLVDHKIIKAPSDYNQPIGAYTANTVTEFIALGSTIYSEDVFKTGAVVQTHRFTDDRFAYQTATYINNEKVLIRHWDNTNKVWLPFVEQNKPGIIIKPYTMQYVSDWVITDFEENRETIHEVSYTAALAMGLPESGTIETYRFGIGRERYARQVYERFNKVETWKRVWDATNNTWKPWVKIFTEA